jgi:hypothetical protein
LGRTVAELLAEVPGREAVRRWGPPALLWAGAPRGGEDDPGDPLPFPERDCAGL